MLAWSSEKRTDNSVVRGWQQPKYFGFRALWGFESGGEHNRLRRKWQDYGGTNASAAEEAFFASFKTVFKGTELSIRAKPKEFQRIYVDVFMS